MIDPCRPHVHFLARLRRARRWVRHLARHHAAVAVVIACGGAAAGGMAWSLAPGGPLVPYARVALPPSGDLGEHGAGGISPVRPTSAYAPGINLPAGDVPGFTGDVPVSMPEPPSLALLGIALILAGLLA